MQAQSSLGASARYPVTCSSLNRSIHRLSFRIKESQIRSRSSNHGPHRVHGRHRFPSIHRASILVNPIHPIHPCFENSRLRLDQRFFPWIPLPSRTRPGVDLLNPKTKHRLSSRFQPLSDSPIFKPGEQQLKACSLRICDIARLLQVRPPRGGRG